MSVREAAEAWTPCRFGTSCLQPNHWHPIYSMDIESRYAVAELPRSCKQGPIISNHDLISKAEMKLAGKL